MSELKLKKLTWQDRVVAVHTYHYARLAMDRRWSVRKTAEALNKSSGSISQDLQLAEFLRSYETQLSIFKNYVDALDWMKTKKQDLRRRG